MKSRTKPKVRTSVSRSNAIPGNILRFARKLRRSQTDTETRLWYLLRNRRLGGHKFRRQHPVERFVLDFYCEECKLAIEVDGGGHNLSGQMCYDAEREAVLAQEGIRTLRFWNNEVLTNTEGVLQVIWEALAQGVNDPHPCPSPGGRGDSG
jgi:very-short-patch-repair endonuclease